MILSHQIETRIIREEAHIYIIKGPTYTPYQKQQKKTISDDPNTKCRKQIECMFNINLTFLKENLSLFGLSLPAG